MASCQERRVPSQHKLDHGNSGLLKYPNGASNQSQGHMTEFMAKYTPNEVYSLFVFNIENSS
jgi:hypothetical protein